MTNTNSIRILIANNDDTALSLATTLENHGADVSYASCDPLQIQFEVLRSQPDVLVLPSITRHTEKLCKLLKSCEHAPYTQAVQTCFSAKRTICLHRSFVQGYSEAAAHRSAQTVTDILKKLLHRRFLSCASRGYTTVISI